MSARKEAIRAIRESDTGIVGEATIARQCASDRRSVVAALEGMVQEGTLDDYSLLGDRYFAPADDADLEQATDRTSTKELAELIIQSSDILGTQPGRKSRNSDTQDVVDDLL